MLEMNNARQSPGGYKIPDPLKDPKHRYVRVTDPAEIAACIRNDSLDCPDGMEVDGEWFATLRSLQTFRREPVEIEL